MGTPEEIRESIIQYLDREDMERDAAYRGSRDLIRSCRERIGAMVEKGAGEPVDDLLRAGSALSSLQDNTASFRYGFVEDALTEVAEAFVLSKVLEGEKLPLPVDTPFGERAYSLGICDAVGELRRAVLNSQIKGDMKRAGELFLRMKELGGIVEGLTYPTGLIPLKKKQDMVRGAIDRTAGELALAIHSRRISDMKNDGDSIFDG